MNEGIITDHLAESEIPHEDVKAFMNEPDPEPAAEEKAPPPMDLDDLAPMDQQEQIPLEGRLTTQQLADFAFSVATLAAARLGKPWMMNSQVDVVGWTNFIINSAANPNNYDVCREIYENEVMIAWGKQIYWPPFSKITLQERMFYFTFRSIVVTLLGVWAGH